MLRREMVLKGLKHAKALAWVAAALSASVASASPPPVVAVDSIGLTVSDVKRSKAFYRDVLGFEEVAQREDAAPSLDRLRGVFATRTIAVRMRLGTEAIELTQFLNGRGRAEPARPQSNDLWFQHIAIVVLDMTKAYRRLRRFGVEQISPAPQRLPDWNPNAGGIRAFYFRDPDGHPLELIAFPPGKGDPRWQRPSSRLFLGIDHTAIAVSDTDASLRFYRDTLGLRIAGTSENYGIEQEYLNRVFGARLRITGLRARQGFGIELLEYLSPRSGRPMPRDEMATDHYHAHTRLITPSARSTQKSLRAGRYRFVSPGVVRLGEGALPYRAGLSVRDPDGHVMEIVAPGAR